MPLGLQRDRRRTVDLNRKISRAKSGGPSFLTLQSVRQKIVVAAQHTLNVNRGAGSGIGIGSAGSQHTQRPIEFSAFVRNAVDCYFLNIMTPGQLSDFCQRPSLQIPQWEADL
jgi:hypothetical protein